MRNLVVLSLMLASTSTRGFSPVLPAVSSSAPSLLILAAKKKGKSKKRSKGFGKNNESAKSATFEKASAPSEQQKQETISDLDIPAAPSFSNAVTSPITSLNTPPPTTATMASADTTITTPITSFSDDNTGLNEGQKALAAMRRERAEQKDNELRKIKEIRDIDEMLKEAPDQAVIPEQVASRMGKRMLPFVGIPLFGVLGTFVAFWYFATYKDLQFQPSLVATSTVVILVLGLLGITYSVMSASWDPERDGSALGIDEFQKNVRSIRDGLSRSRENAVARDQMKGLSEEEINMAINDLNRRDSAKAKRQQSFENKLDGEMD